jgi:hypothetical protein
MREEGELRFRVGFGCGWEGDDEDGVDSVTASKRGGKSGSVACKVSETVPAICQEHPFNCIRDGFMYPVRAGDGRRRSDSRSRREHGEERRTQRSRVEC